MSRRKVSLLLASALGTLLLGLLPLAGRPPAAAMAPSLAEAGTAARNGLRSTPP